MNKYIVLLLSALLCLFAACDESTDINKDVELSQPVISSFAPESGAPGTLIAIKGENLAQVSEVTIGGQVAKIKNRISTNEIVVEVTANALSGAITLQNTIGIGSSTSNFSVVAVVPTQTEIATETPNEMTIGEVVTITGTNLKSVSRVLIGGVESGIEFVSDTQIKFIVPLADAGKRVPVELEYMNGETATTVESSELYLIKRSSNGPTITLAPQSALTFTTVTLEGVNMNLIDKVKLGDKEVELVTKTETNVTFVVPSSYGVETILDLIVVYNGDQEDVAVKDFKIEVPAISSKIWFYGAMKLGAEGTSAADYTHFVDPRNGGKFYTACDDYATIKASTYFYTTSYSTGKTIQLNNPNNSATQANRFFCDGVKILPEEKLTNIVRYRKLSNSGKQAEFANLVRTRTLEEVTPQIIADAGISNATSNVLRSDAFVVGDVIMFQKFSADQAAVVDVGFLEVVEINVDENDLTMSSLTVHCFFQK